MKHVKIAKLIDDTFREPWYRSTKPITVPMILFVKECTLAKHLRD